MDVLKIGNAPNATTRSLRRAKRTRVQTPTDSRREPCHDSQLLSVDPEKQDPLVIVPCYPAHLNTENNFQYEYSYGVGAMKWGYDERVAERAGFGDLLGGL